MRRRQYTNTPTTNRQQLESTTTNPFDSWSAEYTAKVSGSRRECSIERPYVTDGFALDPVRCCCLPNQIRHGIVHS
jgi:hypothetical protein